MYDLIKLLYFSLLNTFVSLNNFPDQNFELKNLTPKKEALKSSLWELCSKNSDCIVLHSFCQENTGTCVCLRYFTAESRFKCRGPLIFESCEDDSHCIIENEARCVRGRCYCLRETDKVLNGFCIKDTEVIQFENNIDEPTLGVLCQSDANCPVKGSYCKKSSATCECQPYYYQKGSFYCRGPYIDEPCALNSHCQFENVNSICFNDKCRCLFPDWIEYEHFCYKKAALGESCKLTQQCQSVDRNSICDAAVCICDINYYISTRTSLCRKASRLHELCDEDPQCKSLVINSICMNKICQCKKGFHPGYDNTVNECIINLKTEEVETNSHTYSPGISFLILMAIIISITSVLAILGKYCLKRQKPKEKECDIIEELLNKHTVSKWLLEDTPAVALKATSRKITFAYK